MGWWSREGYPEQTAPTVAAPTGFVLPYAKSDGLLYAMDDAGVERMLSHAVEVFIFSDTRAAVTVGAGTLQLPIDGSYTYESAAIRAATQPTGANLIMDINKNGTTIYTTQSNRPTIVAGTNNGVTGAAQVTTFVAGDYLSVDYDQIGSGVAGGLVVAQIRLRRTA